MTATITPPFPDRGGLLYAEPHVILPFGVRAQKVANLEYGTIEAGRNAPPYGPRDLPGADRLPGASQFKLDADVAAGEVRDLKLMIRDQYGNAWEQPLIFTVP